jgi:hypothetical protein
VAALEADGEVAAVEGGQALGVRVGLAARGTAVL